MSRTNPLLLILSSLFVVSCASAPKLCTPIESGGKGRIYYGQCLKLVYGGKDLTGNCSSQMIIQEAPHKDGNMLRSMIFLLKEPKGTVSFHGVPPIHGFTGSSLLSMVVKTTQRAGKPHHLESLRSGGTCDMNSHPGGGVYIQCAAEDKTKGITRAHFATLEERILSCREDFPDDLTIK